MLWPLFQLQSLRALITSFSQSAERERAAQRNATQPNRCSLLSCLTSPPVYPLSPLKACQADIPLNHDQVPGQARSCVSLSSRLFACPGFNLVPLPARVYIYTTPASLPTTCIPWLLSQRQLSRRSTGRTERRKEKERKKESSKQTSSTCHYRA